jgi:negative regulator of flagellin synthesis FlgM
MSRFDIGRPAPVHSVRPIGGERSAMRDAAPAPAATAPGVRVELAGVIPDHSVPVDHERVAQIREALRDGTYPIVPAKIADALIAARLTLGGQA